MYLWQPLIVFVAQAASCQGLTPLSPATRIQQVAALTRSQQIWSFENYFLFTLVFFSSLWQNTLQEPFSKQSLLWLGLRVQTVTPQKVWWWERIPLWLQECEWKATFYPVRKQREVHAGTHLPVSFLLSPASQPMPLYHHIHGGISRTDLRRKTTYPIQGQIN